MSAIIDVRDVSMCFRKENEKTDTLKEFFVKLVQRKLRYSEFRALNDVSFSIQPGEAVALIGVNGIGVSNIIVNALLFVTAILILAKQGCRVFSRGKLSFAWAKDFAKIGGISGLESFVRNIAYMLMVSRMVNMVGEQGTYWVANNFIWGWLLLPVLQLGELIKKETKILHIILLLINILFSICLYISIPKNIFTVFSPIRSY